MTMTRADLIVLLDALELSVTDMLARHAADDEFLQEFNSRADTIRDSARPGDIEFAQGRIDCMLKSAGMIPGEDEGEPCR